MAGRVGIMSKAQPPSTPPFAPAMRRRSAITLLFLSCGIMCASSLVAPSAFSSRGGRHQNKNCLTTTKTAAALIEGETENASSSTFVVQGMECVPVTVHFPVIGAITVLEASADSQEVLVNVALEEEDEMVDDDDDKRAAQAKTTVRLPTGDPYGAVLWPASSSIATHLITHNNNDNRNGCTDQTILELGAGTGLVSLAALAAGAKRVVATDYEDFPLVLLQHAAAHCNGDRLKEASVRLTTAHLDFCDADQPLSSLVPLSSVDWVVAADVMYEPKTGRALAHRVVQALRAGCRVLIGDSPGRPGRPAFLQTLHEAGVPASFVDTQGSTVTGDRHDLICGATSQSVTAVPQALTVAIMELDPKDFPDL